MRTRILGLALAATLAACGDDGPPDDGDIRACLEDAGAAVRPAGDAAELLVPKSARGVFIAEWGEGRSVLVMRSQSEEAARQAEDALRDLLPHFRVDAGNVRRAGTLVVSASKGPPSDEVMECVE